VKLARVRLDLQLNVDNLLNYDTPIYNGMNIYQNQRYPFGFRRQNPRAVRLTSTLKF
jgi:hypothetical protein